MASEPLPGDDAGERQDVGRAEYGCQRSGENKVRSMRELLTSEKTSPPAGLL